ncbi:type IVB secretion system protein IcmH/DotU [Pseudomonas sp. Marseille-Q1929]|uniref:type IVB secretion system protein IcmH/DotU n=1 Tax=Pseudomonas sp. Marseille-Q1929 TaxID=2730402 RepID=UPI001A8D7F8B|nr:type IVB secretion system protein IcmH/DotU [Pseudomonas sp. Marseille-Q1929]MBO0495077.1 type IVB secretion system protein IcmH/DotU [Pseudomonas sp. Marseille-Q1929]
MTMDSEYPADEKTILLDRDGHGPAQRAITDHPSPPRFEQLADRMIYAARLPGAHSFNVGLSTLVAAAWAVLAEAAQLKGCVGRESLGALNERLVSAITQFEQRALHAGVESAEVNTARYVLCAVLDEAVVTAQWDSHGDWSQMSLLSRFHHETLGGEKFFTLLERLSRDPIKHVAMLELMYLCLAIGFEGKYRVMERGMVRLEAVRDGLYRQIRHVRGNPPPAVPAPALRRRKRHLRGLSIPWLAVCVLACLLALYTGFAWVLGNERVRALEPFHPMAPALTRTPL